jgi:hypothetical protein
MVVAMCRKIIRNAIPKEQHEVIIKSKKKRA